MKMAMNTTKTENHYKMTELLESYMNGNIAWVRKRMINRGHTLSEVLEAYIDTYNPDTPDILLFVKRLER